MIRVSKRSSLDGKYVLLIRLSSILLAMAALGVFINFMGHNPFVVYKAMLEGCFGSAYRFKETIKTAIPLTITALGIMLAFKMKFWNIGAEGQILMGAFAGSYVGLNFSHLPKPILLTLMLIAGVIGGGIWALIPTWFKVKYGTNETLFTLMMNYIALKWVIYLQYGPWKDPDAMGFPKIPNFVDNAIIPKLMGVHLGWVIAIVLVVVIYLLINYTKLGFEISVIGSSQNTARYAGMSVRGIILKTLFIGGGLCGMSGIIQASAVAGNLTYEVGGGVGYTAIIIAWLSGMSAPLIPLTAFLFAILTQGASFIQTAFQIPQSAAEILQGMILIFALASEFFISYKVHFETKLIKRETQEVAREEA